MAKIIISYRRSDSDVFAGRVRDRIAGHFGEDSVFIDIDSIPFGKDFRVHIQEALAKADAVLVVIGPRWLGVSKGNHSRIKEDTDPVRIEVETALSKGIPTIPILVGQTNMPRPEQLPESLRSFAFINAAPVDTGRDFHRDLNRVIGTVNSILERSAETAHMDPLIPQMSETHHISDTNHVGNPSAPEFAWTQSPNLTRKKELNAVLKQQTLIPKRQWLIALLTLGVVATALVFFVVITRVQNSPGSPSLAASHASGDVASTNIVSTSPSNPMVTSTQTANAAAAAISCSQEKSLRSLGTNIPTSITFTNKGQATVRIYWLNFDGNRILYGTLNSGQVLSQQTYITHPWVVTNSSDQCEAIYMPAPYPQYVNLD